MRATTTYYSKPRTPYYQKWTEADCPPPFHWEGADRVRFRPTYRIYPPKNEAARERGWGIYLCTLVGNPAVVDNVARQRENDIVVTAEIDDYKENKLYEGVGTWECKSTTSRSNGMTYTEWQVKVDGVTLAEAISVPEITEMLLEVPGLTLNRIKKLLKWAGSISTELDLLSLMDTVGSTCFAEAGIKLPYEKTMEIWGNYRLLRDQREAYALLGTCKITGQPRKDILSAWGTKLRETMQQTPEKVLNIDGIGFVKAHMLWMACGLSRDDLRVVAAGLQYTLDEISQEGHCWAELPAVLAAAAGHLSLPRLPSLWYTDKYEDKAQIQRLIHIDEIGKIWSRRIYEAECSFALRLAQLAAAKPLLKDEQLIRAMNFVDGLIASGAEPLDATQRNAVLGILAHTVSVLTGSAGTGKTTIIRTVIKVLQFLNVTDIILCAFTGKAAENAEAKTGHTGITCHSAIGYIPGQRPKYNADSPMYTHSVIIDEVSMLELTLGNMVGAATPSGSMFVLVGDEFQLPPIGPGAILRDVIASGVLPAYRLTKTYRQDPNSNLLELFDAVRKQKKFKFTDNKGAMIHDDIEIAPMSDPMDIKAWVLARYGERLRQYGMETPSKFKVITYRRGTKTPDPADKDSVEPKKIWNDAGVMALNEWIVQEYHRPRMGQVTFKSMGAVYCAGHHCMWLKNTDKTEYPMSNGKEFDFTEMWTEVDDDVDYVFATVETLIGGEKKSFRIKLKDFEGQFMHGYALTIHKSQGSEYPEVVFVIRQGDRRRLTVAAAYTALSRARSRIVVVGDVEALEKCVDDHDFRQTGLTERLIELMQSDSRTIDDALEMAA